METMRIILLASALLRAASAIHIMEKYSASGCAAADLKFIETNLEGCSHGRGEYVYITCNETHYEKNTYAYSGAQCTGAVKSSSVVAIDSSGCTSHNSAWVKIRCNAAVQTVPIVYDSFLSNTNCSTPEYNDTVNGVHLSGCNARSRENNGNWSLVSEKIVCTSAGAVEVTEYNTSIDCTGTVKETTTYEAGVCHPQNAIVMKNCASGAGSVSSGRRSAPWAVATFGAAALAIVAAQHATA